MENPEELLQTLEEFSKIKPRDIPRELEEYLCFVAKTGDPVYQWPTIKTLFREKLINVITEFYESCASMEIPACPNVEIFNYDSMKNFILEKLDTFVAAPFTVQRICELLTTPRKEYNRIDKYMRALEKNILVVSTTEPGGRQGAKNGDSIMNGIDSEHTPESSHCNNDINVEEMDESPSWRNGNPTSEVETTSNTHSESSVTEERLDLENKEAEATNLQDTVITCRSAEEEAATPAEPYVSIEPVVEAACNTTEAETSSSVTITAVPAGVQNRRSSVEPEVSPETTTEETDVPEEIKSPVKEAIEETNEAENKLEEVVKDEDRIILTSTDSGIENISPESSTSSPETLQNEFEPTPEPAPIVDSFVSSEQPDEGSSIAEPTSNTEEPVEKIAEIPVSSEDKEATKIEEECSSEVVSESEVPKDFEVSSSVDAIAKEPEEHTEAPLKIDETPEESLKVEDSEVDASEADLNEAGDAKQEVAEDKIETPMDVDSSSDKVDGSPEINSVLDV